MLGKPTRIAAAAMLVLLLCACGSNGGGQPVSGAQASSEASQAKDAVQPSQITGTWSLTSPEEGTDFFLNLLEDGTGLTCYTDKTGAKTYSQVFWTRKGDNALVITLEGEDYSSKVDGDALEVNDPSGTSSASYKRVEPREIPKDATLEGTYLVKCAEPITIVDDGEILVQVTAKGENLSVDDYGYRLTVENKSGKDLNISARDCSINNSMTIAQFTSSAGHVGPGKKDENVSLYFNKRDASIRSLEELANVDGVIETHEVTPDGRFSADDVTTHPFHID